VQVVAPNTLPNYTEEVLKLTAGCAVEATGMIVPSPAKGQPFEMQASEVRVIGWVDDPDTYPIQPKPRTLEYLREVAHLRPRTNVIGAATRVRHSLAKAMHHFFDENGFFGSIRRSSLAPTPRGPGHCSASRPWISRTCRAPPRARSISRKISFAARRF
jgi:aspartyl/asparaginyl-tRNA synthetase